jgi:hypothetical protein
MSFRCAAAVPRASILGTRRGRARLTIFQCKDGELAWWKNRLFSVSD